MTIEEYQQEVKRIRPGLCRTAIRYLGEADGEDLRTPFNALAQTLLRNHCIDVLRRRHITVALDGHDIAVDEEQDQRVETMMKLIKLLPPMQQTVLQLRHINGMEMAQVAQLTGMKEPAVRKCLSRARQALRTMMLKMMKEA